MLSLAIALLSAQSVSFITDADTGGYWNPRAGTRLLYHFKRVHASRTLEWNCDFHWMRVDSGLVELAESDMVYNISLSGEIPFDARADHGIAHSLYGGFRYPDKRLTLYEAWRFKYEKAKGSVSDAEVKITYQGIDASQFVPAHRFSFDFLVADGVRSFGNAWISLDDGTLLRRENSLVNYDWRNPFGKEDVQQEVVLTRASFP